MFGSICLQVLPSHCNQQTDMSEGLEMVTRRSPTMVKVGKTAVHLPKSATWSATCWDNPSERHFNRFASFGSNAPPNKQAQSVSESNRAKFTKKLSFVMDGLILRSARG